MFTSSLYVPLSPHGLRFLSGWVRTLPDPLNEATPSLCDWSTDRFLRVWDYSSQKEIKRAKVCHILSEWNQVCMAT